MQNYQPQYDPENAYQKASRRVRVKLEFYSNLAGFVIVNAFLAAMYYLTNDSHSGVPWFLWVTIPWAVGLVLHFLGSFVFGGGKYGDSELGDRMLQEELRKINNRQ